MVDSQYQKPNQTKTKKVKWVASLIFLPSGEVFICTILCLLENYRGSREWGG